MHPLSNCIFYVSFLHTFVANVHACCNWFNRTPLDISNVWNGAARTFAIAIFQNSPHFLFDRHFLKRILSLLPLYCRKKSLLILSENSSFCARLESLTSLWETVCFENYQQGRFGWIGWILSLRTWLISELPDPFNRPLDEETTQTMVYNVEEADDFLPSPFRETRDIFFEKL